MMKKTNGITLIVLIITVIVMLILVAVTVSVVINSNLIGIAQNVADATKRAYEGEADVIDGILKDMGIIDWEKAKAEAVAPASQDEERNNGVIGIGTDGDPVDMDLWEYTLLEDGTFGLNDEAGLDSTGVSGRSSGYIASYTVEESGTEVTYSNFNADGTIKGTVPTYISTDGGNTYKPVTSMVHTFYACSELVIAPEIPHTVTDMTVAFYEATNLTTSPKKIPNSVIKMDYTFTNCSKMNTVPELGKSIQSMIGTFYSTAITQTPIIPDSVTNMESTFQKCKALTKVQKISKNVSNLKRTFANCIALIEAPEIPYGATIMSSTFSGCSSLVKGPSTIPSSVTNMYHTFIDCKKLEGNIEINANIDESVIVYEWNGNQYTGSDDTFSSACSDGKGLTILKTSTGSTTAINKWLSTNSKIKMEE